MRSSALCVVALLISYACADEPLVILQHGGQLQGKRIKFNDTDLDIFIGKCCCLIGVPTLAAHMYMCGNIGQHVQFDST